MTEIFSDLDQLNLSVQTYNALRRGGVHTCAQLIYAGRNEVRELRWIGAAAEHEIAAALADRQFGEWTEQGTPLPDLGSDAAQVVQALGLGDTLVIRQGLARVLKVAQYMDRLQRRAAAAELQHGAR